MRETTETDGAGPHLPAFAGVCPHCAARIQSFKFQVQSWEAGAEQGEENAEKGRILLPKPVHQSAFVAFRRVTSAWRWGAGKGFRRRAKHYGGQESINASTDAKANADEKG
jgi:hypothetical protein